MPSHTGGWDVSVSMLAGPAELSVRRVAGAAKFVSGCWGELQAYCRLSTSRLLGADIDSIMTVCPS